MRLPLAALFVAALLAVPLLSGAAPTPPANRLIEPIKLTPTATPVTGPPSNPTTPTLWLKPQVGNQLILSNITETMAPSKGKCVLFAIGASLNAADAAELLTLSNNNVVIVQARVYVPPSIVYAITNGQIKSVSESAGPTGSSVKFTLTEQKLVVSSGSNTTMSDCV